MGELYLYLYLTAKEGFLKARHPGIPDVQISLSRQ